MEPNMNRFIQEQEGIYRLKVPFEDLYTSVFLVVTSQRLILVDCATTADDVEFCIIPALMEIGIELCNIDTVVLTHLHGDHSGGIDCILCHAPDIEVVTDVRELANGVYTYALPGHTDDCNGVLDTRTRTLISGDGIQGMGIGKYRCSLENRAAYLQTLERIKKDERIENILFSHAYEPWCRDRIEGRELVLECLNQCSEYVKGAKHESNTCK